MKTQTQQQVCKTCAYYYHNPISNQQLCTRYQAKEFETDLPTVIETTSQSTCNLWAEMPPRTIKEAVIKELYIPYSWKELLVYGLIVFALLLVFLK